MKSKSADDVIHAYVETILPQIGPSRFILTDIDAELRELEELHRYTGVNCGLKCLQQLNKIWKSHADELR